MSIANFEFSFPELKSALEAFQKDRARAFDQMIEGARIAISSSINQVLKAEIEVFLGNPEQKGNKKNGCSERDYALRGLRLIRVKMPLDRKKLFNSCIVPKHERIDPRLREDMAAESLAGLSMRTLAIV